MARRFHYYNVVITLNGTATTLYFSDFLQAIMNIDWRNRIRKIKFHPTALFHVNAPNQDQTCRVAAIGKYRQTVKPYTGDINSDEASMIDKDIIEMVTMVVAPLTRTALVEYNFYGVKVKDIEDYFNSFFPVNDPRNQWGVSFIPVDSDLSLTDIRRSDDIKGISLKINAEDNDFVSTLHRSQNETQRDTLFGSLMNLANKIKDETDAPIVDLSFGKGRRRKLELDSIEILRLIDLLQVNDNDSIGSCKVRYKSPTSGKYENMELKNVGIKSDVVLEGDNNNHAWEFIGDKILERYIEKGRPGSIATRNLLFTEEAVLPVLSALPREQYAVQVEQGDRH
ncbi:MAG: hypothetical protein E6Y08_11215 [Paenibacillus sp.]|jgi:hypothetical protein|uniref:hypothetical protein n=1 Tax=Paenibacillus sp. TaxID=58172 RepID=UPI002913693B|nr:hypothetical protein [Paenibacillus sp.]MDU4696377.1 hypothetical protein [Paenibacillus sp.]